MSASPMQWWVDPLVACASAAWIRHSAWSVARTSLDQLMDHELPDADRARVRGAVLAIAGVRGIHDLRTRSAGAGRFVQLHLELDGQVSLSEAHLTCERVVGEVFEGLDVIVYPEPARPGKG